MINIGDILEAKPEFLIENHIRYEERFFKVTEFKGEYLRVDNGSSYNSIGTVSFMLDYFYIPSNVNKEILKLISDKGISIKEFTAVTVDGKVINFKATR